MDKQTFKVGFIGLGLIGGSLAKAIRHYYSDSIIIAFDKNKESTALALLENTINISCKTIDDNFQDCDYIFLCAPVSFNNAYLQKIHEYIHPDCILSDVGSVKGNIHKEIEEIGLTANFIGGHPMTGSEKSGYSNSKRALFENAYYIMTPTPDVSPRKINDLQKLLKSIKAIPYVLNANEHDYVTGVISHLPHILAAALVEFVQSADSKEKIMKKLAAGGFRDITRIASSSPTMWQQICLQNDINIIQILDDYIHALEKMKEIITDRDASALYSFFESAKEYRNSIVEGTVGAIKKSYAIYCDIIDETGGIASIATILAENNINIKNIGIIHNREFEEGVLRIEFYDREASKTAAKVLQKYRYIIYEY